MRNTDRCQQNQAPQRRAAFSEEEYRHRLDRIRTSMQANGIDLLLAEVGAGLGGVCH